MGGGSTIYFCYPPISQPRARSHITHCRSSWMVLLKVHIFSSWVRSFLLPSPLSPETHYHAFTHTPARLPRNGVPVGNLRTHSTGSRALQDLAGVRLSFIAPLLQTSWLARWRAWFRANKLLPGRCAPPPSSRPAAVAAAPAGFPQS